MLVNVDDDDFVIIAVVDEVVAVLFSSADNNLSNKSGASSNEGISNRLSNLWCDWIRGLYELWINAPNNEDGFSSVYLKNEEISELFDSCLNGFNSVWGNSFGWINSLGIEISGVLCGSIIIT